MNRKTVLWIGLSALALTSLSCIGTTILREFGKGDDNGSQVEGVSTEMPSARSTATAVSIPPLPINSPAAPPADSDLLALIGYASAMQPLLGEVGTILKRDGEILKASEGENDAVLCDGRLETDNEAMEEVLNQVRVISPPADAAMIHDLVLRSGDAWNEALDYIEQFCDTGNQLYKVPAILKFWEAAASIQDAGNRFWLLILSKGVEDWVQR